MTVMMTMVMLNAAADDDGGHASDDYDNDASRKRHREAGGCFSAAFYILPRVLNSSQGEHLRLISVPAAVKLNSTLEGAKVLRPWALTSREDVLKLRSSFFFTSSSLGAVSLMK